jgi:hypothetical protein
LRRATIVLHRRTRQSTPRFTMVHRMAKCVTDRMIPSDRAPAIASLDALLGRAALLLARARGLRTNATLDQRRELLERCSETLLDALRLLGSHRPPKELLPDMAARVRILQIASDELLQLANAHVRQTRVPCPG